MLTSSLCTAVRHLHALNSLKVCDSADAPTTACIMGDFNKTYEELAGVRNTLPNSMHHHHIGCTTALNYAIDHVFAPSHSRCGTLGTYFSYHKAVYCMSD